MVHPHGKKRQANSICARSTRIAGSEREQLISSSVATSTSFTANSIGRRHPAMTFVSMLPNQPSAYTSWRKTESSRIANTISVMESMY
jgi:hypothetical protein